jgi:HSP20 family protein
MANRFDPFRDLDRLAERMLNTAADVNQAVRAVPVDLYRAGDHWVLKCDLPGADPGSLEVGVDGRILTIRAVRSPDGAAEEWLAQERARGTFVRQLTLGTGVDLDGIQADYTDGVLTLTLPVAEAAKPRTIEVTRGTGAGQGQISGQTA